MQLEKILSLPLFSDTYFLISFLFILISVFIFGTIIGSFLNVVIFRFNTGKLIAKDRSRCMNCNKNLEWFNLIPIFSWVIQRGKCSNCNSRISKQYPLVEFFSGLIFVLIFLKNIEVYDQFLYFSSQFFLTFIFQAIIFSILIIIFVYDLRHKIIPDEFSFSFAALSFLVYISANLFFVGDIFVGNSFLKENFLALFYFPEILNLLSGFLFFLPIFILWFFSKGEWIGLGDGKLVMGIGWFLGFSNGLSAILIGIWLGAIFGLILMLISKLKKISERITMKTEIPFGPFLILGTILNYFFSLDVLNLTNLFR